jgi:hypothetical protein
MYLPIINAFFRNYYHWGTNFLDDEMVRQMILEAQTKIWNQNAKPRQTKYISTLGTILIDFVWSS